MAGVVVARARVRVVAALARALTSRHDLFVARNTVDVSKLTPGEKLDLIDELWQSLRPEDLEISPEQQAELDRRLERLDRDGPHGVPWQLVRAEMTSGDS